MRKIFVYTLIAVVLSGCATAPMGPRVEVRPAPGKPFDVFVGEDQACRQYAAQSIGLTPSDSAARSFAGAAAAGTVIGAAAGAMSGGHGGNGAAGGLVAGSMIGASQSQYASRDA